MKTKILLASVALALAPAAAQAYPNWFAGRIQPLYRVTISGDAPLLDKGQEASESPGTAKDLSEDKPQIWPYLLAGMMGGGSYKSWSGPEEWRGLVSTEQPKPTSEPASFAGTHIKFFELFWPENTWYGGPDDSSTDYASFFGGRDYDVFYGGFYWLSGRPSEEILLHLANGPRNQNSSNPWTSIRDVFQLACLRISCLGNMGAATLIYTLAGGQEMESKNSELNSSLTHFLNSKPPRAESKTERTASKHGFGWYDTALGFYRDDLWGGYFGFGMAGGYGSVPVDSDAADTFTDYAGGWTASPEELKRPLLSWGHMDNEHSPDFFIDVGKGGGEARIDDRTEQLAWFPRRGSLELLMRSARL
jgi:hypothetical protein